MWRLEPAPISIGATACGLLKADHGFNGGLMNYALFVSQCWSSDGTLKYFTVLVHVMGGAMWFTIVVISAAVFVFQTYAFLDYVCISQTDIDLKMLGIANFAGFLRLSKELVVLWDEKYFTRFWCVYELASYMTLNPTGRVRFSFAYAALLRFGYRPCLLLHVRVVLQLSLAIYARCMDMLRDQLSTSTCVWQLISREVTES